MKLLILTQSIDKNNPICGFFLDWVLEFDRKCEKVTVICLEEKEHDLPENIKILSLGKEKGESNLKYIFNFYRYIWQERKNYDNVFVHMTQIYMVMGGLLWRLWNKKIGLWYAHGGIPFALRFAEKLTHIIFTSNEKGFRLKSRKIKIVGQGIDTDKFKPAEIENKNEVFKIITIGRIARSKDIGTLVKAVKILKQEGINTSVDIIGSPGMERDRSYLVEMENLVKEQELMEEIKFLGPIPNNEIIKNLQEADLFASMSLTGSLDKTILESMACELPVITCNEAAIEDLDEYVDVLFFQKKDYKELANKIKLVMGLGDNESKDLKKALRERVVNEHGLKSLVTKISKFYE